MEDELQLNEPHNRLMCVMKNTDNKCYDFDAINALSLIHKYQREPIRMSGKVNNFLSTCKDDRKDYITAAVELEIFLDRIAFPTTNGIIHQGIPFYIMDGYTDLGADLNKIEDRERAKFRISKEELFKDLKMTRKFAIASPKYEEEAQMRTAHNISQWIYRQGKFDYYFAKKTEQGRATTLILNDYGDEDGQRRLVCRQLTAWSQALFQAAGIESRLVKGNFSRGRPETRHVWQEIKIGGLFLAFDITNQNNGLPSIVTDKNTFEYFYEETDPLCNHYKIK